MSKALAIQTIDLVKRYAEVTAVDALSLQVRSGEIYGFLGRNGAGKTTTIRMLLGLVHPTAGKALIFGRDVAAGRAAAVAPVGSLVETATAYPTLSVRENLEIHRRLTGSTVAAREEAIALMGLQTLAARRAGHLSLGNKQRLGLARALLPAPKLLVLDEPANGLDPAGIVEVRHLLRSLCEQRGVTVFVSSHILAEVAQLADRIGIIHRGSLVDEVDVRAPGSREQGRLALRVSDPRRAIALALTLPDVVRAEERGGGAIEITGPVRAADVARLLVGAGLDLQALVPVAEDLEARFLRLTSDETEQPT